MKIKIFNREICVCALQSHTWLATNSRCAKSSREMRGSYEWGFPRSHTREGWALGVGSRNSNRPRAFP